MINDTEEGNHRMSASTETKLTQYAQNNLNVLLIGSHGIGKTMITKGIADKLGLKFKYYSAPTLEPFADIVGIPVPNQENKTLEFFRSKDLEEAEFLMFDELNRAHPRVLNAVLEIIQFKTINGTKLPKLKMVWAAINPPGESYQVEELDPALIDRFHCYIKMVPNVDLKYFSSIMKPELAVVLKNWWDSLLDDHMKKVFTPRRLEYLGLIIDKDLPWRDVFPQGHPLPIDELAVKINKLKNKTLNEEDDLDVTKENILSYPDKFIKLSKENPKLFILMQGVIKSFNKEEFRKTKDLLEVFPQDLLENIFKLKFAGLKRELKQELLNDGVDLDKYPKLSKAIQCKE